MQDFGILLFTLLGMTSVGLWWQAALRLRSRQALIPYRERSKTGWNPFAFLVAMLWISYLAVGLFVPKPNAEMPAPDIRTVQAAAISSAMVFAVVMAVLSHTKQYDLTDFGISLRPIRDQLAYGTLGFLTSVFPVVLMLLATHPLRTDQTQHSFFKVLGETPTFSTVAWIAVTVIVLAPAAEELIFRVAIQGSLVRWMSPNRAILVVALLFSSVHGWPDMLALFPLALILGYVYHQRHSFLAVVVLHALFNAMNLFNALLLQSDETVPSVTGLLNLLTNESVFPRM